MPPVATQNYLLAPLIGLVGVLVGALVGGITQFFLTRQNVQLQRELAGQNAKQEYLKLAISILADKKDADAGLRAWAFAVFEKNTPEPLNDATKDALNNGQITLPQPVQYQGPPEPAPPFLEVDRLDIGVLVRYRGGLAIYGRRDQGTLDIGSAIPVSLAVSEDGELTAIDLDDRSVVVGSTTTFKILWRFRLPEHKDTTTSYSSTAFRDDGKEVSVTYFVGNLRHVVFLDLATGAKLNETVTGMK